MRKKAEKYILNYLNENPTGIDILDCEFIDGFAKATGAKVKFTYWGANKCNYAAKTLSRMCKAGILERFVIGLGNNWQKGFPKWVYVYRAAITH